MPKPIVCLSAALFQFAETFRPCFSQRQWKYFVTVPLGLIEGEGRRTMKLSKCKDSNPRVGRVRETLYIQIELSLHL
jgi:hypothetical protein